MPQLSPDLVYNPTNLPLVLRWRGMSYTFEPFKSHFFTMSRSLDEQMDAIDAVYRKLGRMGAFVVTSEELEQHLDASLPEAERVAAARVFLQRLQKEGQNKFLQHLRVQYEEMPGNDNRRLAGVQKAPLMDTAVQRRMKNLITLWEKALEDRGDLSEREQMLADERAINRAQDVDLTKLNWKALRKVASERGVVVKRGTTMDELLAQLVPGYKPAEVADSGGTDDPGAGPTAKDFEAA